MKTIILSLMLSLLLCSSTLHDSQTINFDVRAREPSWQFSNVTLTPGFVAEIRASGKWGVIDPVKRGLCGPAGNGVSANRNFVKPGAPEGCLLIRIAEKDILHFKKDDEVITIATPGRIEFMANDEIRPPEYKGFDDNAETVNVQIKLTRIH